MADLPGRSDYEPDDRARADDDEGWGSPLPAEYGSLRAVRPRPPEPEPPQPQARPARERSWMDPERGPVASLLRRIQGEPANGGPAAASVPPRAAPAMPSRLERARSAGRGARGERPDLLHRVRPDSPPQSPPAGPPPGAAAAPPVATPWPVTGPPAAEANPVAGAPFARADEAPTPAPPDAGADGAPDAISTAAAATAATAATHLPPEAARSWYDNPTGYQRTTATPPAIPAGAPPVPAGPGRDFPAGAPGLAPDVAVSARNRRRSARRPARVRSRATIRHLDITTVIRVSVLFWLVVLLAMITASVFLWSFADAFGTLPSIEKSVRTLFSLKSFKLHPTTVAFYTGLAGLVLCIAGTIANVICALIYNLIADVVGGVRVELESFSRE